MGKLPFKVVSCTGEDPEFPAAELNVHSPSTKGWLSPRFCEFPQELIIGFQQTSVVRVQQVQFLSHQSKIATKLEIFVGKGETLNDCTFKRLGYMSLDNNERSGHRARELKSVYVDAQCSFMKIRLHKCYINKFNLYNQVGLIAVNVLGEQSANGAFDSSKSNKLPAALGGKNLPDHMTQKSVLALDDLAFDMNFDEVTAQKIRQVNMAKQFCVSQENYEAAKSLKVVEQQLKVIGVQLAKMVTQKRQAVQREDYDVAQSLKGEIDRLRTGIEQRLARIPAFHEYIRKANENNAGGSNNYGQPSAQQRKGVSPRAPQQNTRIQGGRGGFDNRAPMQPITNNQQQPPQQQQQQSQVVMPTPLQQQRAQQQKQQEMNRYREETDERPLNTQRSTNAPPVQQEVKSPPIQVKNRQPNFNEVMDDERPIGGTGGNTSRSAKNMDPNAPPAGKDLIPRSPIKGQRQAQQQRMQQQQQQQQQRAQQQKQQMMESEQMVVGQIQKPAYTGNGPHPLEGVPNYEQLVEPEPLSPAINQEATKLIEIYGEYIVRCLYSRTWALREAALQKINLELPRVARENGNLKCFGAVAQILNTTGRDKVSQVFLGSLSLLQTALATCSDLRRGEVTSMLNAFTVALVEKVGDSNGRVRQEAQATMEKMAQATCLGPPYVSANILRKPKKQHLTSWRPVLGRLGVIRSLVMTYGLGPTSGLSLDACMEHVKISNGFMHPNNNVRICARDLCVALYAVVGDDILSYLGGLREKQLEEYKSAFQNAGGPPSGKNKRTNDNRNKRAQKRNNDMQKAMENNANANTQMVGTNNSSGNGGGGGGGGGGSGGVRVQGPDGRDINININVTTSPKAGGVNNIQSQSLEESTDDVDPFTCQFCGRYDPNFTEDSLDMHYWKECPVLTSCRMCGQVVEIMCLHEHMSTECEHKEKFKSENAGKLKQMAKQCPLCQTVIKPFNEAGWRRHLLSGAGCSCNSRTKHLSGQ